MISMISMTSGHPELFVEVKITQNTKCTLIIGRALDKVNYANFGRKIVSLTLGNIPAIKMGLLLCQHFSCKSFL